MTYLTQYIRGEAQKHERRGQVALVISERIIDTYHIGQNASLDYVNLLQCDVTHFDDGIAVAWLDPRAVQFLIDTLTEMLEMSNLQEVTT